MNDFSDFFWQVLPPHKRKISRDVTVSAEKYTKESVKTPAKKVKASTRPYKKSKKEVPAIQNIKVVRNSIFLHKIFYFKLF